MAVYRKDNPALIHHRAGAGRSRQGRQVAGILVLAVAILAAAALSSGGAVAAPGDDPSADALARARVDLAYCTAALESDDLSPDARAEAGLACELAEAVIAHLGPQPTPSGTASPPAQTPTPTPVPSTSGTPPPTTPPPTSSPPVPAAGFPNASNTGVPAGTMLRNCGGAQTVTVAGTVIDGCLINGSLRIRANNVTVKRSKIQGGNIDTGDNLIRNALIEDVEIDGLTADGRYPWGYNVGAIDYSDFTARRVNAHGTGFGIHMGSRTRVIDSYLHDWTYTPTAHQDGIISNGGRDLQIIHNNIECDDRAGCSAALGLFGDWSPGIQDVLVERNLLNTREGYCTHAGTDNAKPYPDGSNIRFINNTFGRKWNPRCGNYGPVTSWESARGNVWTGNVWIDGGTVNP